MPALGTSGQLSALGGQEVASETGGLQSSCREWEHTWRELTAEAECLELECAEERLKFTQLVEYQDDANDSPMGARIGLWNWMDECLWGDLAELRAEVKAEEKGEKVSKDKKAEKVKKEKREASSSDSSDDETHEKDKKHKKDKKDKKNKKDKSDKKEKKEKKGQKDQKDNQGKKESQPGGLEEATTGEEGTSTCDIKPKLGEFRAQHTNLAAVLEVTRTELEGM